MTVRSALRAAAVDTYQFSWRLFVLNTALSAGIVLIVVFVSAFPLVLFVAPLVTGPLAAGLVYSVVTLIREQDLRLSDAVAGLRRWELVDYAIRRGLPLPRHQAPRVLAAGLVLIAVLGVVLMIAKAVR